MTGVCGGEISYITLDYINVDESVVRDKVIIINTITPASASKFDALGALGLIYMSGTHSADIPYANIKKEEDFKKLEKMLQKKAFFISNKKSIVFY